MIQRHDQRGFSLIEIVVTLVVVSILFLLMISGYSQIKKRSWNLACQSNLREWGSIITLYCSDHYGELPINERPRDPNNPDGSRKIFFEDLAFYGGFQYPLNNPGLYKHSILACPAEETLGTGVPFCYGLNIDLNHRINGDKARVRITSLNNTSSYVLMSDTYRTSMFYTHTRKKFEEFSLSTRRHDGYPNFLYADGRVASFREPFLGWGDSGGNSSYYHNLWFANGTNPTRR